MPQQVPGGGTLTPVDQLTPAFSLPTGVTQPAEPTAVQRRPGIVETVAAAFNTENTAMSAANRVTELLGMGDNARPVAGYTAWNDIQGTPYEEYWSTFVESQSAFETATLKSRIDRELEDRRTLQAAGGGGFLASIVAGVADPTFFVPVGGQLKAAGNGVWSVSRSALSVGTAGFAGVAAQEGVLQSTQDLRTAEESLINVGSGTLLAGLLGGGSAALMTRAERDSAAQALERIALPQQGSIGAASVDRATLADLTPSTTTGFGSAALKTAEATRIISPNLRAQFRASPAARQASQELAENTLYQGMHDVGATLGAAAETQARVASRARLFDGTRTHNAIFAEAKKAGIGMSRQEFEEAIGRAMRRGDQGENEFVGRAAEQWRTRVFDPFKNDAIDLGLLPPDVDVATAQSYFSRIWNRERLTAQEPQFKQTVTEYYAAQLARDNAAETENLRRRLADVDQEVADLRLGPDARVQVLAELQDAGARLDASAADQVDRVSNINDMRRQQRAAREAGDTTTVANLQARIEAEQSAGGEQLKTYLRDRRNLRSRYRRVDLNYAGMNERYDGVMQSLVDVEESNIRSINRVVNKGRQFEREMQRLDPTKLKERISSLRTDFIQVAEKADKAADRAAKALRKLQEEAEAEAATSTGFGNNARRKAEAAQRDRVEKEVAAQRNRADRMNSLARRLEAAETFDTNASMLEVKQSVDALVNEVSNLSLARGEKAQRLKERLARLDTSKIDERIKALDEAKMQAQLSYNEKWGVRTDVSGEGFTEAARDIADQVFDKLTGRAMVDSGSATPEYMTAVTRGPMKDRTFNIPDELVEDFLESNVMSVAERYGRTMAGEIELTRRFGRADMREQIRGITDEYRQMREIAAAAKNGDEAKALLPPDTREAFAATPEGKKPSVEKVLKFLRDDEKGAIRDLEGMRDLIRGTYKAEENAGSWGRIVRAGMAFNYLRSMGGVLFANLTELYRPAMVHGLGAYMNEGVAPLMKNLSAVKMSVEEAQLAGQVTERVLQDRLMSLGEVGDPYRSGSPVERWLQNGTRVASQWNGLVYWTDAMKSISSVLSQNRIIKGVGGEGDTRFLAYLGIDRQMGGRIAEQFATHGETLDSVRVANTQSWTDSDAVRAYRAAVAKDVDSIIVTKSVGDTPLFANTPTGKAMLQFRGFMFASHQRVLLRGMQESKTRFLSGVVAMSAIGMLSAWARSWRGGKDRHDKFVAAASNPGYLLAEGLDLTGIFALPFDIANTGEKLSQSAGFSFNPIKAPIMAAGAAANPGASMQGESTRFSSRGPLSTVLGPSAGLVEDTFMATGAAANLAQGDEVTDAQRRKAVSLIPFGSYVGMKEVLQATTGDSPYQPQ